MKGEGRTKRKTDKLQFVCLIGGRVFNPRQQQNALNIYNLLLPRVTNPPPN